MIENRKLGTSELYVSPVTFGGNVFGWTLDKKASFRILDAFVDAGFNFIDTADSYSRFAPGNVGGESETIIGDWLKNSGKREEVIIATKLGSDMGDGKKGLSERYMTQAVEDSLKRLGTDYIDLYQSHYDDPGTSVEETMESFNKLVVQGKVRYVGASNLSAARIREANEYSRKNNLATYVSLQPLYNLYSRQNFELEYADLVAEEQMAVLPYFALASGFLTGKYRSEADFDKSPRGKGMSEYMNDRGFRILGAMDEIAELHHAELSQIAIAWLLHQPMVTSPIASATSEQQLASLVAATQIKLSKESIEKLNAASK